jgi:predicted amidohydrolase YtcJ
LLLQRKVSVVALRIRFSGASFFDPASKSFSSELFAEAGLVGSAGPVDQEIELGGGFVFPAFRDGHAHPLFAGREAMGPVVTQARTLAEIQEVLRSYRDSNPHQQWIEGGAYDRSIVEGGLFLSSWIDEVISDVPVVLHASDHHTIWVNSKSLELIPSPMPNLVSGSIDLDSKGKPQGVLREPEAMALVLDRAPAKPLAEEVKALVWADRTLASYGIVEAQDAWITKGMTEIYLEATRANALLLDYNLAFKIEPQDWKHSIELAKADRQKVTALGSFKLSANTVKFFADGVFGSATASVLEPYFDPHGSHGEPLWSDSDLKEAALLASELGFQLHIHAIGDAGVRQALDAIEFVQSKLGKPKLPNVIAHAELISDADIPRFKALSVVANMQPLWAQADGMLLSCVPRLGKVRIDQLYRMRDLISSGAIISFGSDWPVSSSDPILGIATAVTRATGQTTEDLGWTLEQALTVQEALDSYTSRVQYQLTGEQIVPLAVGEPCDFVVLDKNPLQCSPAELRTISVLRTYKSAESIGADS